MSARLSDLSRTERRKVINRRVVKRIDEVTLAGMKDWNPILDIIRRPTDDFVDATDAWLAEDTPDTRDALQNAADALVRAWREAGRQVEAPRYPEKEVPT